jgi:hypothetical protein
MCQRESIDYIRLASFTCTGMDDKIHGNVGKRKTISFRRFIGAIVCLHILVENQKMRQAAKECAKGRA